MCARIREKCLRFRRLPVGEITFQARSTQKPKPTQLLDIRSKLKQPSTPCPTGLHKDGYTTREARSSPSAGTLDFAVAAYSGGLLGSTEWPCHGPHAIHKPCHGSTVAFLTPELTRKLFFQPFHTAASPNLSPAQPKQGVVDQDVRDQDALDRAFCQSPADRTRCSPST